MMKLFHEMESWGGHNLIKGPEKKSQEAGSRFPKPCASEPSSWSLTVGHLPPLHVI